MGRLSDHPPRLDGAAPLADSVGDRPGAEAVEDPNYYDAQAAGWWVWGISLWIGPGWCQPNRKNTDQVPHYHDNVGGRGVSIQGRPHMHNSSATGSGVSAQKQFAGDKRPHIQATTGACGVSAQKQFVGDQRPYVSAKLGANAVTAQTHGRDQRPRADGTGSGHAVTALAKTRIDLVDWFDRLAARLKGVIVLNRGWESAVTPTVLMQTPSGPKPPAGILLDPPYLTADRSKIYGSDMIGESNRVAKDSYEWALEHGDSYRVAYCCHEGDFEVPEGWTFETNTFGGIKDAKRSAERRDMVMFSPACVPVSQGVLW